jgi:hypothetical protein
MVLHFKERREVVHVLVHCRLHERKFCIYGYYGLISIIVVLHCMVYWVNGWSQVHLGGACMHWWESEPSIII